MGAFPAQVPEGSSNKNMKPSGRGGLSVAKSLSLWRQTFHDVGAERRIFVADNLGLLLSL
jgi:hypothetical protein